MSERMPTAYRVPTGLRQGTALKGGPNIPVQDVKVALRPVTQHGIGVKMGQQGPGRGVFDKSYYVGIIRQKSSELRNEIDRFNKEMEEIARNNNTYLTLERRYDALIKEVRTLEGELADYNLALDKKRADTKPEDVMAMFDHIKTSNQHQREELDQLFLERKEMEDEIARIEGEIASINARAEERLSELDHDQRQEYIHLHEENKSLEDEINQKRTVLESVNQRLLQADAKLRTDVLKQKAHHLREQKDSLIRKKEDLAVQTNELNLSEPEARERLLARIKADNQNIKETKERIKDVEKAIANYKKQIEDMENDLKSSNTGEMQKYEILYQKDKEMTEFIQSFEQTKQSELEMIKNLEESITSLLEQISRLQERSESLSTQSDQIGDFHNEYDFKMEQMTNAAVTQERLKAELDARRADLEKVRTLDQRIPQQLSMINEKIAKMTEELRTKYNNSDAMKQAAQQELVRLQKKREGLLARRDGLSAQLRNLNIKLDVKKQQLGDEKIHKELQELDQKLSFNEQTLYGLRQYIASKGAETNYKPISNECSALLSQVNNLIFSKGF